MTGRTVINLGHSAEDYPFKNFVKQGADLQSSGGYDFPTALNNDGYPTTDPTQNIMMKVVLPPSYSGHWVLKWVGTGAVHCSPDNPGFTVHSGGGFVSGATTNTMTVTGANARVEFSQTTPCDISFVFGQGTVTYSGMSKLVLCRLADEAAVDLAEAGDLSQMFNDDYVASLQDLNLRALRFLDFLGVNISVSCNLSRYTYWPAVSAMSYRTRRFHSGAWVGDITGTNTVVCGASPDTTALADGVTIQGRWVTANTGACTLNFNGTGAQSVVKSDTFATLNSGYNAANTMVTMVYDLVLDKWIIWNNSGFIPCLPVEVCVALCNKLSMDCWFTLPHLINDAGVTSIVTVLKGLTGRLFFEYSNELWNTGTYGQGNWATARGVAMGIASGDQRQLFGPVGKRHCEVMALTTAAWSPRTDLKRVYGVQAFATPSNYNTYAFGGADLGAYGFNSFPNRPIDRTDVVSHAPYTQGAQCQWLDSQYTAAMTTGGPVGYDIGLLGAADLYEGGTPTEQSEAMDWLDWDLRQGTRGGVAGSYTLASCVTQFAAWTAVINSYSKELACYEDAWQSLGPTQDRCTALTIATKYGNVTSGQEVTTRGTIQVLLDAYKNDNRFTFLCIDKLNALMDCGVTTGTIVPAWLLMDNGAAANNPWGMREGDLYSAAYKSLDAFRLFNGNKRRFRITT